MKVLVTGASGFVGAAVVRHLAAAGHQVRAAARQPERLAASPSVEPALLPDLARAFDAGALMNGTDAVVHAAGLAHQPRGTGEAALMRVNAQAAGELARAAAVAGVRTFILVSSIRAISGPSSESPLTEDMPPAPSDAYGRSKRAGELAVRAAFPQAIILRPPAVHGAGAAGNMQRLAALAKSGLPLPLGGLPGRHSIVSDANLASAIAHLMDDAGASGGTFHVDDGVPLSLADIVGTMRVALGRPPRIVTAPRLFQALLGSMPFRSRSEQLLQGLSVASGRLRARGWVAPESSAAGLARLARH
jgi:nucleoside-diphosphate-sugar epimerase